MEATTGMMPRRFTRTSAAPVALALALLTAGAPAARAGVVRGRLHTSVTAAAATANAYPGRASSMCGPRTHLRGAPGDAVISVERIPASAESLLAARASRPKLAQRDQSFVPRVLPVAAGSVVDFPNLDPIFHNVFSVSPARRFDLGKYPRGQSRPVRFPRTGLVNVYCDIHTDMAAYVLVLPNHAFTQPDGTGAWALPDLPAGRYLVRWWHPDLPGGSREVDVPATGAVDLELSL